MASLIKRIAYKIARKKFVRGFDKFCANKKGRALVYFKTEEFMLHGFFQDFSHVNNWESYEISRILNTLGFVVDIIDRTATISDIKKYIKDEYDIFIGIGAGDSGQYFSDIAERIPKAIKVLYAMGPEPDLSNRITKERHDYFRRRHPDIPIIDRRLITAVDTDRLYRNVDSIITIGNDFSYGSYLRLNKDLHKIFLSTYPELFSIKEDISLKNPKKFLYFGGNGNITKGLDLVLEVFEKRPDLELYIGAPSGEEDFNVFANKIINKSPNIHNLGFVDVTSEKFINVTKECAFVVLPSSSEGCATSVTTCMRRALIPIVTIEAGIDIGGFGILVEDGTVEAVGDSIDKASKINKDEVIKRAEASYSESEKYTHKSFSISVDKAIRGILHKHGFLI